jgi:Glycosyl transferase family 2
MNKPRITVSLPCWDRPEQTILSIECIGAQTINNWEAFIMGDACPHFQKLIDSGYLEDFKQTQEAKGNIVHYFNRETRGFGYGYLLTNYAFEHASGEYFVFYANDDILLPNHFEHYLSEIENTDYDMVYFKSFSKSLNGVRDTLVQISCIGHCDIIVNTEFAKTIAPHAPTGFHDWTFIEEVRNRGKIKKADSKDYTYVIY